MEHFKDSLIVMKIGGHIALTVILLIIFFNLGHRSETCEISYE